MKASAAVKSSDFRFDNWGLRTTLHVLRSAEIGRLQVVPLEFLHSHSAMHNTQPLDLSEVISVNIIATITFLFCYFLFCNNSNLWITIIIKESVNYNTQSTSAACFFQLNTNNGEKT